jgi:hypothetical protein
VGDARFISRFNCQDDGVSFGGYNVGVDLIEIEDDSRDERLRAVLRSAYLAHTIHVYRNISRTVAADCVRKIQQDAIWLRGRLNRGLDWSAERNLYAQIGTFSRGGHMLHRRRAGILCRGARQQEHRNRKMFVDCRHSSLTLAGAPPAA